MATALPLGVTGRRPVVRPGKVGMKIKDAMSSGIIAYALPIFEAKIWEGSGRGPDFCWSGLIIK